MIGFVVTIVLLAAVLGLFAKQALSTEQQMSLETDSEQNEIQRAPVIDEKTGT
ncbi:hypothetical protein [Alicyclobacillus dauci]|uniref:Tumour necrosis factor receptor superfamily member 19 n=1 Tax=Alicyclobacillus dauci TaxID=1475485 RepID=A0ABY6YYS7_9BACL|nr:hypothetical protein [Alicyclobacillus dauci]WAH35787.1 hypothetical protein NZD86_16135 [Alicyclobacillus dauci]